MGTWGEGPFDNDDAGDMIAALSKKLSTVVGAKSDAKARDEYNGARAAAQIVLLAHGTDILGGPGIDIALEALLRMRLDTEWLAGYREPKKIAKALDDELASVLARMTACTGCRRTHGASGLKELGARILAARKSKPPKSAWLGRRRLRRRTSKIR
jgi:hypothetical protein